MKRKTRKVRDGIIASVLTFVLAFGMVPVAFAAPADADEAEGDDPIVYVSIGDSMTNGYGLDGYDGESGVANYANGTYGNSVTGEFGTLEIKNGLITGGQAAN